jgi:hypothetical protein
VSCPVISPWDDETDCCRQHYYGVSRRCVCPWLTLAKPRSVSCFFWGGETIRRVPGGSMQTFHGREAGRVKPIIIIGTTSVPKTTFPSVLGLQCQNECALDPVCTTRTDKKSAVWRGVIPIKGTLIWPYYCLVCHSQTDILPGRHESS